MKINIKYATKATINNIIVALLISLAILLCINIAFGKKISEVYSIIEKVALSSENEENVAKLQSEYENAKVNLATKTLSAYPKYGTQYATIEIEKIDVNLPVYFGDTLDILKKGVGHSSGSYFPGEGGSIIYMGHNSTKVFRRFSELEIGDTIKVTTSYGEYNYSIYDMQIVNETETEKLPIQHDEEILMVYTCYPFNNVGYAYRRYVVYAKLI